MRDNYESWGDGDNPYLPSSNTITSPSSFASLRKDDDLYKDEDNVVEKIFNVRINKLPNNENNWEFIEDGKTVFALNSNECSDVQKKFLYTSDGMVFILNAFKKGIREAGALKEMLINHIK